MNTYYLSLCRGLVGYYVLFEAPNEDVVREHAHCYFGRMWCSVYTEPISTSLYPAIVINPDRPIRLDTAEWE